MIIKKILYALFKFATKIVSAFWPYSATLWFKSVKTKCYTLWISNEFGRLDAGSSIGYPLDLRGAKNISIGSQTFLGKRGVLTTWEKNTNIDHAPQITIGNNVSVGDDFHITAINKIVIGNNVLTGKKITITDNSHGINDIDSLTLPPAKRILYSKGPVVIEDNVWIGDKVTILPGVVIGTNSIIGANSVVTKSIPENSIAGGNPARVIKVIS